jgi:hypothetical protein
VTLRTDLIHCHVNGLLRLHTPSTRPLAQLPDLGADVCAPFVYGLARAPLLLR